MAASSARRSVPLTCTAAPNGATVSTPGLPCSSCASLPTSGPSPWKVIRCEPLTFTPDTGDLSEPTTSEKNGSAGDCICGSASRSNAALKFAAVTAWPFENFVKPALTVKSYVFPLFETFGKPAAASGINWDPFAPLASG